MPALTTFHTLAALWSNSQQGDALWKGHREGSRQEGCMVRGTIEGTDPNKFGGVDVFAVEEVPETGVLGNPVRASTTVPAGLIHPESFDPGHRYTDPNSGRGPVQCHITGDTRTIHDRRHQLPPPLRRLTMNVGVHALGEVRGQVRRCAMAACGGHCVHIPPE